MHINDLLEAMEGLDATDLYVKAGCPPTYRIHGHLTSNTQDVVSKDLARELALQMLTEEQRHRLQVEQSADLAYSLPGRGRFRVNVYVQRGSVALVARRVKLAIPSFDELRLPAVLRALSLRSRGLILVTGHAGTGKSTTLAAMVDYRNSQIDGHIVTVEDPIEFLHPDKRSIVSQREVGTDTPSFADALRSALRQTPDVLLIGEMRDRDSAEAALYFAETGHLVLSTLHSVNASQALERMLAFFPSDHTQEVLHRLSLTLEAIVSQRLVLRSDRSGRVVAVEIMVATPRIRELIKKGEIAAIKQAIELGVSEGMQTFDQALFELHRQGLISYEDALRAADSANDLKLRIKGLA
ncbi:MAG: PilT/PilU family type 4a pilus ATPase [Armatimonadota bacterium]|nr:PilT/PilU family type 4a pilus ATPase [Armatimonadota bacterium]